MVEYFERMFRFAGWANRRILAYVRETLAALPEALPLLAHLLAVEHVWLRRLQSRPPSHPTWPALDLDECAALASENEAGYREFLGRLAEAELVTPVCYRTGQGHDRVTPVLDILTQVIAHGPYHRGQIAKIVGRHGGAVENTDFITFAGESAPRRPNRTSQPTAGP